MRRALIVCPSIFQSASDSADALSRVGPADTHADQQAALLSTPVASSLRLVYPQLTIDWLTPRHNHGLLQAMPAEAVALGDLIALPGDLSRAQAIRLAMRIARRYDLALALDARQSSHRFAVLAARAHVSVTEPGTVVDDAIVDESEPQHAVAQRLAVLGTLGVDADQQLCLPRRTNSAGMSGRYAVLAPDAVTFRQWPISAWLAVAQRLLGRGLGLVIVSSAGSGACDMVGEALVAQIAARFPGLTGTPARSASATGSAASGATAERVRVVPRDDWADVMAWIHGAQLCIAVDPVIAQCAASADVRTACLLGPDNPQLLGPWVGEHTRWRPHGDQRDGRVWLFQSSGYCVPCAQQGCERRSDSPSACLDWLPAARLIRALDSELDTVQTSAAMVGMADEALTQ